MTWVEARLDRHVAGVLLDRGPDGTTAPPIAFPVAGLKHEYQPPGYPADKFVPRGHSVIVSASASFRFTYSAMRERHQHVAELLAGEAIPITDPDALPDLMRQRMQDLGAPRGIARYRDEDDVPALEKERSSSSASSSSRHASRSADDLRHIINVSMTNW